MMLCMGQDCKRRRLCRFLRDIVPVPVQPLCSGHGHAHGHDVHSGPYTSLPQTTESADDPLIAECNEYEDFQGRGCNPAQ